MQFCKHENIPWNADTYLYMVYTGSASALFNGITVFKKDGIKTKRGPLPTELLNSWDKVQIVVIDKESFLNRKEFDDLYTQLHEIGHRTEVFGGFSIIFAGDFCQFEPVKSTSEHLLFSAVPPSRFEQLLNATVILENKHHFRDGPECGELLNIFGAVVPPKNTKKIIHV